jgi:hypothetical protein
VKALVFLLVLVNLLFYAFSAGYFGRPENPDAGRVEKQVAPERMRIVSRGETPGKGAEAVKPGAAVEVSKAEEAAPVCLVWANLTVADADQLQALLTDKFAEFKVLRTTEAGESNGWWVFIPPLAGKAEADKKTAELRRFGITDYFVIPEGSSRFAISLGVFSSEKGGQDRLAELKQRGIRSARLTPRPGKETAVSLQVSGPLATRAALLETVGKAFAGTEAQVCK